MTTNELLDMMRLNREASKVLDKQSRVLYGYLVNSPGFMMKPISSQVKMIRDNAGLFAAVKHYRESFNDDERPDIVACKEFVDSL